MEVINNTYATVYVRRNLDNAGKLMPKNFEDSG